VRFVWDEQKAVQNLEKHGIAFEEAATIFADPLAVFLDDLGHPENARIIGQSNVGHILLVVFIDREADLVRLISARPATSQERRRYEEGKDDD
jgi:uncharacterized DUF497 family protein